MRTLACLSAAALALALPLTSQRLNEDARRERVMHWAAKATPADCEALTGALTDESYDIRNRAASALYWRCERASAAKFAPQLCRSIELGIAEAGAVLLLGYTRSADAALCLREAASRKEMVKLTLSSKPVPMSLPAQVAMARLGEPDAILALRRLFDAPDLPMTLFLLGVLRDIEDRSVLLAGVRLLNDDRQAPGVSAHGTRHVHDVALEALVARLTLRPSFRIEPGRHYAPNEIAEIRTAAEQALTPP